MEPVEYAVHKRQMISAALDRGMIHVFVDSTVMGVQLPPHLMQKRDVRLNLSHRFKDSLYLKDDGVCTWLSFGGVNFPITIPWKAIYVFVEKGQNPILFIEDAPMEDLPGGILDKSKPQHVAFEKIEGGGELTPPRTGHLRLVH